MVCVLSSCATAQQATLQTASAAPAPLRAYRLGGETFYALDEVARHCGFSYEPRGIAATLRAGERFLRFSADSRSDARKSSVDGYDVWLSDKVQDWGGRLMLMQGDYAKTIYPILWPQRRADSRVRTIILDAGHGGRDEGTKDNGLTEKFLTLDVTLRVKSKLEAADSGLTVLLTRVRDTNVALESRTRFARDHRADLFVSIHFNALASGQARGIETYCLPPAGQSSTAGKSRDVSVQSGNRFDAENVFLAHTLHAYAVNGTGMPDHGVRRARFEVLTDAPYPAALIECGFVTNPTDASRIATATYRDQLATSITRAILAYKQTFDPQLTSSTLDAQH
jgi:N-acetylmuramoyl-L-alanine amidase